MKKAFAIFVILSSLTMVSACGKDGAPQNIPYGQKAK